MFLAHIVLVVCTCSAINYVLAARYRSQAREVEIEEDDTKNEEPVDIHTFIALIDIVFNDYSKRTCTGTIIHDNTVITAAHCFVVDKKPHIQPELTASFVVIGTKKMFDSNYEQYLPIERVVTHPKFRGWTADIALVYTFSGMTSDKPGTTVPLDGERTSTPVDSNVTVLSWGRLTEEQIEPKPATEMDRDLHEDLDPSQEDDCNSEEVTRRAMLSHHTNEKQRNPRQRHKPVKGFQRYKIQNQENVSGTQNRNSKTTEDVINMRTKYLSRYLPSSEIDERTDRKSQRRNFSTTFHKKSALKSRYKNWRRNMGSQKNTLTVEVFGFVNMQVCKKMVEKTMPAIYEMGDGNDYVCYASEEHYVTAEDSGAPAIRLGHLVAVTVGGTDCEGDHVAVGMKMSCYCSWIAENLPDGASKMKCCKNCCDVKHSDEPLDKTRMRV